MIKILIVAATKDEINPLFRNLTKLDLNENFSSGIIYLRFELSFLITGIGGIATAVKLAIQLNKCEYDLVLNAGIAGSLRRDLMIGQVVIVAHETFGDLGSQQADGSFCDLFEMGLQDENDFPFTDGKIYPYGELLSVGLPEVAGISVNRVHGEQKSILEFQSKFNADIETMEGAAFYYTCYLFKQPSIQFRSISNFVEKRDRAKWDIPLAIKNLNMTLFLFLERYFP